MKSVALILAGLAHLACGAAVTTAAFPAPTLAPSKVLSVVSSAAGDAAGKLGLRKTETYTSTSVITAPTTVTITTNLTVYAPTTYYKPYVYPDYVYVYTDTKTTTYTNQLTALTFPPPPSTTYVGPRLGFTPIKAESFYTDYILVKTVTVTSTPSVSYDPSPTTFYTYVFGYQSITTITSTTDSYVYSQTYVTSTSTIANPVRTRYADCNSYNLADKIPTGQDISSIAEIGQIPGGPVTLQANAEDCCAQCMADPSCIGGSFDDSGTHYCFLDILGDNPPDLCKNSSNACQFFGNDPAYPDQGQYTIFNGPAGVWGWTFFGQNYVKKRRSISL